MKEGDDLRHPTTAMQWWMPWASSSLRASGSLDYRELISGRRCNSLTKLCSPPASTTSQGRWKFPVHNVSSPGWQSCITWGGSGRGLQYQCRMRVEGGTQWGQAQHRKTSTIHSSSQEVSLTACSPLEKVRFKGNHSITALNIELWWEQKIFLHYNFWRLHYTILPVH